MLGLGSQIGPFILVVVMIIELLCAIGVADVAPPVGADGVVVLTECRDADAGPAGSRIGQDGLDVVTLKPRWFLEGCQIAQGRIHTHEIDRAFANTAGLCHSWNNPNEGGTRGLLPQGELPPVFLLTKMPAVVAPEDNDGVVLVR